jgi:hypothetical protein
MKIDKEIIFLLLALSFMFLPKQIHLLNQHFFGRFILVAIIAYISINNVTIGLFMALALISASNQFRPFVMEGMETASAATTTTASSSGSTSKVKGVDKEAIRLAILAKASNSMPPPTTTESDAEVAASTEGMLNGEAKLEGFLL